jgi:hypothetical protein
MKIVVRTDPAVRAGPARPRGGYWVETYRWLIKKQNRRPMEHRFRNLHRRIMPAE